MEKKEDEFDFQDNDMILGAVLRLNLKMISKLEGIESGIIFWRENILKRSKNFNEEAVSYWDMFSELDRYVSINKEKITQYQIMLLSEFINRHPDSKAPAILSAWIQIGQILLSNGIFWRGALTPERIKEIQQEHKKVAGQAERFFLKARELGKEQNTSKKLTTN
jgi:hypothetical protein